MHYIIGTRINTAKRPVKPGSRVQSRIPKDFQPDKIYELFHIKQDPDGKMRYVWLSTDQEDAVGILFDTISEADKFISNILQENIPNYEEVYARNTS